MPAGAGRDSNQAVGAFLDRLMREHVVDHVMHDDAAIAMDGIVHLRPGTKRRDNDRHAVPHADGHVVFEPGVAAMDDLVHGKWRGRRVRMGSVVGRELSLDPLDPLRERAFGPGIEGGERADNTGFALRDHQVRV